MSIAVATESQQRANTNERVLGITELPTPAELVAELPVGDAQGYRIMRARQEVRAVLSGLDERLLVIIGPCSIHDPISGLEYATRLAAAAREHEGELLVVMRSYFEKPRTTVGWKGLVNDPHLDGSHDMAAGLRAAREFMLAASNLGLPLATEFLEPLSAQYLADVISWGAIGARTTESQTHRQLVSGLSMPVGFKNGTDGSVQVAIDACQAAGAPQSFMGISDEGRTAIVQTAGNQDAHLILRGGADGPNFAAEPVAKASAAMESAGMNPRVIVDASHANSGKSHVRQGEVIAELAARIAAGDQKIAGIMAESFLVPGAQKHDPDTVAAGSDVLSGLTYGQSVTDACMGWDASAELLQTLAAAVRAAR
ncbi:3-deoxy-7-phosphoheptulonate synthase [Paeniglutamicibacter psychrophenolicus]|uniref:Phospho-2-dehydro-3-deoxyheptonate aldolase n=1 Tax=Paeniglutamicibacter psychrophenolicus TaxID=257454 RepID=A0ABS4WDZ1_9MICC|nr:3-deoxy-7-phosphoheptulonate synthase [Paeniglutamicibacter psychrophenolicus]MBP2373794.1 3-deoxy-7-phosphoheptulonate synthase [Paeniglutamicibacter psychrophenolicus]